MIGTTALTVCYVIAGLSYIYWIAATRRWMKRAQRAEAREAEQRAISELWETEFAKISGISHNFLNACRLLSIHRNGRVNIFTFARHEQIFTIETMGLLSDQPDEWRRLAGLLD